MKQKLKTAKLHRTKNQIFPYKFYDPIDKRWTYIQVPENRQIGTVDYFGAARKFMGEIDKMTPVKIDFEQMMVTEIKSKMNPSDLSKWIQTRIDTLTVEHQQMQDHYKVDVSNLNLMMRMVSRGAQLKAHKEVLEYINKHPEAQ